MKGCALWRRLAAATYDSLLILAIWFFATALWLPFTAGEAIAPGNPWYMLYLGMTAGLFFTTFWRRGGQTPGMKAWHVRMLRVDNAPLNGSSTWLHAAAAMLSLLPAGAGFWIALLRSDRRCLHDLIAKTCIIEVRQTQGDRTR